MIRLMPNKELPEPNIEDIYSPVYEAIWSVVKEWELVHNNVRAKATGNHVQVIYSALREKGLINE